eukprot:4046911-Prymnesium_polylepis.2
MRRALRTSARRALRVALRLRAPVHIAAAYPRAYTSHGQMLVELFGSSQHGMLMISASEVALLLSHKRALEAIARSTFAWGAVFDDDVVLHPDLFAHAEQAACLIRVAVALEAAAGRASVVYLGSCDPACLHEPTETQVAHLPSSLLRGGLCQAYCAHAYALSAVHASTFFVDLFCSKPNRLSNSSNAWDSAAIPRTGSVSIVSNEAARHPQCETTCHRRPCLMDWAMRDLTQATANRADMYMSSQARHEVWIVGGGFQSPWARGHVGVFVQNKAGRLVGSNLHAPMRNRQAKSQSTRWRPQRRIRSSFVPSFCPCSSSRTPDADVETVSAQANALGGAEVASCSLGHRTSVCDHAADAEQV